ncbi:CRTAC1 family protein [Candidatus Poribacteria bacterium]|nr:CRTAC1 family protein [Candidatus Poribacteria bacterium]
MGSGAAFFDYDNDGDIDLYIVNSGIVPFSISPPLTGGIQGGAFGNVLYRNDGNGSFTDVTEIAGVGDTGYGMGVVVGDYDNDGDEDLYVVNFGPNVRYRNNGDGTFTDVTQQADVEDAVWGICGAFVDIDRDADLDLFVVNYVEYDLTMKPCMNNSKGLYEYCHPRYFNGKTNALYRNNGDGTFTNITKEAGIYNSIEGKGMGIAVGDYNNDGWPDIYVSNDTTRNFLYRNNQDGTFTDVALYAGCGYDANGLPQGGMGADSGDYNNDGWLDIFVANSSRETNTLYKNNGDGTFTDITEAAGLGEPSYFYLGFAPKLFDYDNDGDLDIFVACGHVQDIIELLEEQVKYAQNAQLYRNNGDGRYTEISSELGGYFAERYVGRGAAFGDYDNDGDTDIFVVNSNQPAILLRNDGGNQNNWLQIQLVGTKSNRDGIGARIKIVSGGLTQIREIQSGSSYASESDRRIIVGLGKKNQAELIEIRWPSGIIQTLKDVKANQFLKITEP